MLTMVQAFIDRPLIDASGLNGSFEWALSFSISASLSPAAEASGISIVTALREQFGLKLEPRSHPMEVLVIDSVEMPTPN